MEAKTMRSETEIMNEAELVAKDMGWFGDPWTAKGINPKLDSLLSEAKAARVIEDDASDIDQIEAGMAEYEREGM